MQKMAEEGDEYAALVRDAFFYQISKDAGAMAAVLNGKVDQIILIAGDSDFVPAAKLARREGVDFILDPMWADIKPDLFEHIDGLKSQWRKRSEKAEAKK